MRKHRNARTHWTSKAARRPDGLPNRAMARTMSPFALLQDLHHVSLVWAGIAGALMGAPSKETN